MESPLATLVFKRLFGTCYCQRAVQSLPRRTTFRQGVRCASTYRDLRQGNVQPRQKGDPPKKASDDKATWDVRKTELSPAELRAFSHYGYTTAEELREKGRRPRRLKMTMRDFIEDSLYNPTYGYFSSQAVIFDPGQPFDFNSMRDEPAFYKALGERYTSFENELDAKQFNETRQLWHTPTELFRPHYAEAMARYFVANYKLALYPYHDLIIYEMGAGNGTFMRNVLDYIRDVEPEVYARTKYKIVEISSTLAKLQTHKARDTAEAQGHADKVEIINKSIFEWNSYVPSPCFFVALEVFDNFGHDVVRYNLETGQAMQGTVLIDTEGEMYEFYTPEVDRTLSRYLRVRDAACQTSPGETLKWLKRRASTQARREAGLFRRRRRAVLSERVYVPTRLMQFFEVLHAYFPAHRLLCSDFHSLPDAVSGINAPVVQTRYQRTTVPVTTPLVRQGYFDILFPTDFAVTEDMYRAITGKLTKIDTHEDFMRRWAFVEETETMNGENPLLAYYKNASFMTTV